MSKTKILDKIKYVVKYKIKTINLIILNIYKNQAVIIFIIQIAILSYIFYACFRDSYVERLLWP